MVIWFLIDSRPHLVLMYYLKYWYASCTKHRSSLTCIIITITMLLVSHHICSFFHHHQYNNPPTPSPLSSSRYSPCWYPTSSPLLAYSYDSWILCLPSGLPTHHLIQDIIFLSNIFPMMIIYNITNNIFSTGNAHLKFEASVSLFLKGVDQLSCLEQPILFLKTNLNPPSPLGKPPVKRSSVVVTKCLPDLVQVLGRDDTKGPHRTGTLDIFNCCLLKDFPFLNLLMFAITDLSFVAR